LLERAQIPTVLLQEMVLELLVHTMRINLRKLCLSSAAFMIFLRRALIYRYEMKLLVK
jgi:hypothetical protein